MSKQAVVKTSRSTLTSVRLPHPLREAVEGMARQRGVNTSAVVVSLLQSALCVQSPVESQSAASPAISFSEN